MQSLCVAVAFRAHGAMLCICRLLLYVVLGMYLRFLVVFYCMLCQYLWGVLILFKLNSFYLSENFRRLNQF